MTFGLTLIFMFLVFWRPQEWLMPWMFGWPVLDVVFYASLLFLIIETDQGRYRFRRHVPQPYLLGGLFVAVILSHLAHTYFGGIVASAPEAFKICFFTLVMQLVMDKPHQLRKVTILFVAMACVMAIHAILQDRHGYGFAGARPLWVPAMEDRPAQSRSLFFGIFEDPNDTAQFLATAIPLAFAVMRRKSFLSILVGAGITWLLVEGILTTHSRGGMVALTAVSSLMLVLVLPERWFPLGMAGLLGGFIIMCPLSAPFMDMSAQERVVFWGMANEQFKHNLIFGLGYNMFWQVASSRAAHNQFVLCYTEVGTLGYWFWFGLLSLGIAGAWRARKALNRYGGLEERWLRRFSGLGIVAIVGFSASGYFLSRAFVYPMFFLFALLGAIPVVAERYLPEEHPPLVNAKRDIFRIALPASLISILYIYFTIVLINKAYYGL